MPLSRRRFVTLLGFGIGALGLAVSGRSARRAFGSLRHPTLSQTSPGAISPDVSATLVAMVEAMLQTTVERTHYASFFAFYAEQVPGYRSLYERLAGAWNAEANARARLPFTECPVALQRAIADAAFPDETAIGTAWAALTRPETLLSARYFRHPVVRLFARTDALTLIGYEDWPGQPRLLDRYTKPLAS